MGPANRWVAFVLAVVWLVAGVAALYLAVRSRRWILLPLAALAMAYGFVWGRVTQTGRKLVWPRRR